MAAIFLSIQLLIVFFITSMILHKYGNLKRQHPIVTVSTLISWFFAFVIIFLIPLDVVLTVYQQCTKEVVNGTSVLAAKNATQWLLAEISLDRPCKRPSSFISRDAFLTLWELVYWTSQILTWLILPVMQSYCKMGDFSVLGKLKSALVENAIYYASFAALFVVLLIYVAAKGFQMTPSNLKTICITASNTWGLFWLVILLGYGLVEIPRKLWLASFVKNYSLQKIYFEVEKMSADKNDAMESLHEVYREAKSALEILHNRPILQYYAEIIMKQFPDSLSNQRRSTAQSSYRISAQSHDEKSLAKLHGRAIEAVQAHFRCDAQWTALITKAFHLEDVASNQNRADKIFLRSTRRPMGFLEALICVPRVEWLWECILKRPLFKVLAAFCALMSVVIVWCEVTFFLPKPVLSLAAIFIHLAADHFNYNFIEVASILTLFYLCICAYYTVFRIKIYRYYHLDPHHNSDENSLLFSAMVFCRLTPPLCLNFLGMIHMDSHVTGIPMSEETAYTSFMGHMDVIPFIAKGFNVYFPMAILLFCLGTYFRLVPRFLHYIGVEQFIDDDEMTAELIQGGKALVSAERNKIQRASDREAREEFWREKLTDHDPSRPLRRNLGDKRSFPGGTMAPQAPNYSDRAPIVENAEPMAAGPTDDPFANDASQWFSGSGSSLVPGHSATRNSSKGIFDDL